MYKTMKQIILIAIGLISLLPVSAQVLSKEESAKLGNTLENLAREGQRKHREEVMAKQRKEQQRAAEVENRTQLGLHKINSKCNGCKKTMELMICANAMAKAVHKDEIYRKHK